MLLSCLALSMAAQDMKSVFVSMPDSITPLLTKVNKEDCVDFLDSNMKAEVSTRFGGTAEMKVLTDDYVLMQTTPASSLEMKLLPVNDSTKVICMVKTVCATACDSEILNGTTVNHDRSRTASAYCQANETAYSVGVPCSLRKITAYKV